MLNTSLILLFCLAVGALGSASSSSKGRLIAELFQDYDRDVPPGSDELISPVAFSLDPTCMELSSEGELEGSVWERIIWQDDRLVWEPKNYSGISVLRVHNSKLWKPDIVLYSKKSGIYLDPDYNILIYSTGKILSVPDKRIRIHCTNANFTSPWALQECKLKYGSWTYHQGQLKLSIRNGTSLVSEFNEYCPLKVLDMTNELTIKKYDCCEEDYASIEAKLRFQRQFLVTPAGIIKNPQVV
uniref:Neuronal acetylcholine receptor subunit alpha-3 n=1 Tax=Caligus rogercresseyi TaxID=217165 RepID=C1BN84_CALRO|nr:Neuronal acetylcholine receptor subunit alpha-3 precursor [Caligus rogercresseyi]